MVTGYQSPGSRNGPAEPLVLQPAGCLHVLRLRQPVLENATHVVRAMRQAREDFLDLRPALAKRRAMDTEADAIGIGGNP
ncbi:hypothetical protein SAMN04244575_05139 [Sinorhizobium meliloti]|nr:hypothetical protein SAMN04244575_05139 [Sinorhizobium meliloti]